MKTMTCTSAIKAALVASAMLASSMAHAAFQCTATLNAVLVYADGTVNVNHSGRNDYTVVCNLNAPYKGVPTAVCAAWTATLLQTKRANGSLQFYYDGISACYALPTYGDAPAPIYIGIVS